MESFICSPKYITYPNKNNIYNPYNKKHGNVSKIKNRKHHYNN